MKIRAIRVAEFGRFKQPTALEGLSGGLDLLVEPNEAGKSTLVRALRWALEEKHRSAAQKLTLMQHYDGGAPLVEVDFEMQGEFWRIRKRFLAERAAELRSLSRGTVARGADAETKLEELLGQHGAPGGMSLLWLEQGQFPETLDKTGGAALRSAVEREITESAGGSRAREVRRCVLEALGELVTAERGRPRKRYQAAIAAAEQTAAELTRAREAFAAAEHLLERLGHIEAAIAKLTDARVRKAVAERISAAADAVKLAREHIAARDGARVAVSDARAANAAAEAAARAFRESLAELGRLEREAAEDAAEAEAVAQASALATERCEAADAELGRLRADASAAEARLQLAHAVERKRELEARASHARVAAERARALDETLAGLPRDAALLTEARRLASSAADARLRLEATSAVISIAYAPGAAGRIKIGERLLGDGERVVATEPVVLDIPGLGRIEVEPGASGDHRDLRAALFAHEASLSRLLSSAGAPDMASLEAGFEKAARLRGERSEAQAELRGLAPEGLAGLEEALRVADEAASAPDADTDACMAPVEELRVDAVRRGQAVRAAEARFREEDAKRQKTRLKEVALSARTAQRGPRIVELKERLPAAEARARRISELEAASTSASRALDEALRVLAASERLAPDAEGLRRMELELEAARSAQQTAEQQAAAFSAERARVEGELAAAHREDIAARLDMLEAENERCQASQAAIGEEVEALRLLDTELAAEEERLKESFLAPVLKRLPALVDLVFPGAALSLGSGYDIDGLRRGEMAEKLERLSSGTREQIAILVRLAFGRLLADQGLAVPVLLDDALVYSDDDRIAAMHRALEAASAMHQVIILTCREHAFADMRGKRVSLAPWDPTRA